MSLPNIPFPNYPLPGVANNPGVDKDWSVCIILMQKAGNLR